MKGGRGEAHTVTHTHVGMCGGKGYASVRWRGQAQATFIDINISASTLVCECVEGCTGGVGHEQPAIVCVHVCMRVYVCAYVCGGVH